MATKPKVQPQLDRARVRREAADIASLLEELQRRSRAARLEAQRSREYAEARERVRATGGDTPLLVWRWVGSLAALERDAEVLAGDFRAEAAGKRLSRRPDVVL